MNNMAFKNELRSIFAAHGKVAPSEAIVMAVWKRVESFPDAFMVWASSHLADYEKLPSNLGLELAKGLYPRWRAETDQAPVRRQCCPDCDSQMPGFFYAWRKDEAGRLNSFLCRCLCNADPALGNMPQMSKGYAGRQGLTVMPADWQGGPAGFERTAFGHMAGKLAKGPVKPETRQARPDGLAEAEAW